MMDVLNKAIKLGLKYGASQVEAYGSSSLNRIVEIEGNDIKTVRERMSRGIGIRLIYSGGIGFAYTENLSEESIDYTVKKAISVAKIRGPDPYFKSFPEPKPIPRVEGIYFNSTAEFELDEAIKVARNMVEKALEEDPRVKSVAGNISLSAGEVYIANSLGMEFNYRSTSASASVFIVSKDKGLSASGFELKHERDIRKIDFDSLCRKAVKRSIDQLNSKRITGGRMWVVLNPIAVMLLFSNTFNGAVTADNVQEKRSFLVNKLEKEIAFRGLNIIDDPLMPEGINSRPFDAEGVASRRLAVVENGILKSYLYDTYRAQREGIESTGHASRGYSSEPGISPSNLVISSTYEKSYEDLISEVDRGLIIRWIIGAHTANIITGEFSVAVGEGYYVENGEIKYSVKQAMLGGNILDLLAKIVALGRDREKIGNLVTGSMLIRDQAISA